MATVNVKNISSTTGDAEVKDFFSFWYVYSLFIYITSDVQCG